MNDKLPAAGATFLSTADKRLGLVVVATGAIVQAAHLP